MSRAEADPGGDRSSERHDHPQPAAWRRHALRTAGLTGLLGLVQLAVAAAIVWSWRAELPDQIATHWSSPGAGPDGFSSLTRYVSSLSATGVGCIVLIAAYAAFAKRAGGRLRILAATNVWLGGMLGTLLVGTVALQRGLTDAHVVTHIGWVVALAMIAPLIPAVVVAVAVRGDAGRRSIWH